MSDGRPLVEYESRHELYNFLNVPNNPQKHWANCLSWGLAECMFDEIKDAVKQEIGSANYVAMTADEVTTVDNSSWISIHAYVVKDWVRVPYLIALQHLVGGASSDNLTSVILKALELDGGLDLDAHGCQASLFWYGWCVCFQGVHNGVVK